MDHSEWDRSGGAASSDQTREQHLSGGLRRSKRFVRKPSVQTETKYIELMVVNDNDMVSFTVHVATNHAEILETCTRGTATAES